MKVKIMKIGIITYHRACNYGAYLQACALCARLNKEEDLYAEIIDFHMNKENEIYSVDKCSLLKKVKRRLKRNYQFDKQLFGSFKKALDEPIMKKSKEYCQSNSVEEFRKFVYKKYDVIIAGSDEIWKVDSFRGFPTPYWLIGDLGCRKFSYAVSARVDFSNVLHKDEFEILKSSLEEFEYIGVRDVLTFNEITDIVKNKNKVHLCCDPSFLYDFDIPSKSVFELLYKKAKVDLDKKNIVVMTESMELAESVRRQLHRKYNLISVFHKHYGYNNIPNLSPMEWLTLIKNADFVITSYFHATCYSIILDTPFIAVGTGLKRSKLCELFMEDGLRSYYMEESEALQKAVNWEKVIVEKGKYANFRWYVLKQREMFSKFIISLKEV